MTHSAWWCLRARSLFRAFSSRLSSSSKFARCCSKVMKIGDDWKLFSLSCCFLERPKFSLRLSPKNLHTKTTECEHFTTQEHITHKIQWASVATRSTRDAPRAVNSNRGEKLESASRFYVRASSYLYTFFFLSRKSFWTLVRFRGKMMVSSSVKKRGLRIRNARGSRRSVAQTRVKVVEMNARAFDSCVYVFSRWIVR